MAAKKKNTTKGNTLKRKSSRSKGRASSKKSTNTFSLKGFMLNKNVHMVLGLFIILFSIYLFIANISFIYNWIKFSANVGADDFTGQSFLSVISDRNIQVNNITGRLGAWLSFQTIRMWFGIGSLIFPLLIFAAGVKIFLKYLLFNTFSLLKHSLFWVTWLSITFGFMVTNPANEMSVLGGVFGSNVSQWLSGALGRVGTGALLIFALTAYIIWVMDLREWVIGLFEKQLEKLAQAKTNRVKAR